MNTVSVSNLIDVLQRAGLAAKQKSSLPILSNVLLEFTDKLNVRSTDLDVSIATSCTANISEQFATTVDAKKLLTIAKSLDKSGFADFGLSKNSLTIKSGTSRFTLPTIQADEFPSFPEHKLELLGSIEVKDLIGGLLKVSHAQSSDETRYVMNGTFFCASGEGIECVATDGRRLAVSKATVNLSEKQCIIPKKSVEIIVQYSDHKDCTLYANDRMLKAVFDSDDVFVTKLVEGTYPNWKQVFKPFDVPKVTVNSDQFRKEVSRASLMASDTNMAVGLTFTNNKVTLKSQDANTGESECSMECEYDGPEVTIAVNHDYLIEALAKCGEQTEILVKDTTDPMYLFSGELSVVIMPLRK